MVCNCSLKGFRINFCKKLLSEGYNVAATSISVESLTKAVGIDSSNFLPLQLEVLNEGSISQAFETTIKPLLVLIYW